MEITIDRDSHPSLVALAIQGMLCPDVIKLSSSSLFQLLFPIPVDRQADDGDFHALTGG